MSKPSFLNAERPLLTVMINGRTLDADKKQIDNALRGGAEAFCIQLERLLPEYRTDDQLKELFSWCEGKPIYITTYRLGMNDEECVELMLRSLAAGATLCDVMGDLYHAEEHELTLDAEAVVKQKALIEKIHALGGEVLMSSHLHAYLPPDEVLRYARAQKERGVDIVKIVSEAHDEEQRMANIELVLRLKRELGDVPFLFLNCGEYGKTLRQIGPALGVCMYLCLESNPPDGPAIQPLLSEVKAIRDAMNL